MIVLSITSELGRIEEFFSEVVYPLWPLWLAGAIFFLAAAGYMAYRAGAFKRALQHRAITGVSLAVFLAVAAPVGYYAVSPLFDRNTVCEASPIPGAGAGSDKCEGVEVAATAGPTRQPTDRPSPTSTYAAGRGTASATLNAGGDAASPSSAPEQSEPPEPTNAPAAPTSAPTANPAPTPFAAHVVRQGTWQSADSFHYTIGDALLIETSPGQYTLRVENFSVRNGPDVFVLLSPSNDYQEGALNLGELKGTDGAFNYEVPAGTDVSQYASAIIWCRAFDVLFGHAVLQ